MRYILLSSIICLFKVITITGQINPFDIVLEAVDMPEMGGLQSYAYGQYDNKWLIIGGRLDGLHRRQPFASFDIAGHNNQLIVVDPLAKKQWSASLEGMPTGIREQLSSTNMEFLQEGTNLFIVGGYGYSASSQDHQTFGYLTVVDVPKVIRAIVNGTSFTSFFHQFQDPDFAVTGGRLEKIDTTFYLVGGQRFSGRYNPMGPDHGPGFEQVYANEIRKFNLAINENGIKIKHLKSDRDTVLLHRRDYNVVPQIMPDGREGITAFSGVFQYDFDIPYLDCVNITSQQYKVQPHFNQYYNHYHCPTLPVYAAADNSMHTVFFGGIAQYYDSLGTLVQNNNVPFVNTIARVSRDATGKMSEYKLPVEMPALLGAGAEFIPLENLPQYRNGVLKLDSLPAGTTHVGYIYGGIDSQAPNIFWANEGEHSKASQHIYKVYIVKGNKSPLHQLNEQSAGTLLMQVYPSPFLNPEHFQVKFHLEYPADVHILVQDAAGKKIDEKTLAKLPAGDHFYSQVIENPERGGTYIFTIAIPNERATQKIIIEP
jgi:hypothetical protein